MAKVVVVEDDVLLAKMYTKLLNFEKHSTVVESNGEKALDTIKKEQPDIVFMDVMMPRMNGLQALDKLKADPATADIPVVVMSNLVNVNSEQDVLAKGAVKYIDKGQYDPKKISQLVTELLGEEPQQASTPQTQQPAASQAPAAQTEQSPQEQATPAQQPASNSQN